MTMSKQFTQPFFMVNTRFEGGFVDERNDLLFGPDSQIFTTADKARTYFNERVADVKSKFASATNTMYDDLDSITPAFTCDVLDGIGNRWKCVIEVIATFPDMQPWEL